LIALEVIRVWRNGYEVVANEVRISGGGESVEKGVGPSSFEQCAILCFILGCSKFLSIPLPLLL